jgi:hypothetical protein
MDRMNRLKAKLRQSEFAILNVSFQSLMLSSFFILLILSILFESALDSLASSSFIGSSE